MFQAAAQKLYLQEGEDRECMRLLIATPNFKYNFEDLKLSYRVGFQFNMLRLCSLERHDPNTSEARG